jgi:hypothetical protein
MLSDPWVIAQSVAAVALVVVTAPSIIFGAIQLKAGADASKSTAEQAKATTEQARSSADAAQSAAKQAAISAKAASASALGAISTTSRELQWKVLNDEDLQSILTGGVPLSVDMKRQAVRGMLINYYAFVYEIRELEQIPDASWQAFKTDMSEFFTQAPNKARWEVMRPMYPKQFQDFVEYELLHRPH